MVAEQKLRTLASQDATLQGIFGTAPFRWQDTQLQPGYIQRGTCARVLRVSTVYMHCMAGMMNVEQVRFQIDVLDLDSEKARAAATALDAWFETVSFMSDAQFGSPPVAPSPPSYANFKLNQRHSIDYALAPPLQPYCEMLEYRIFSNLNT